jgi:uncharacterized protein (TIGR02001 family)
MKKSIVVLVMAAGVSAVSLSTAAAAQVSIDVEAALVSDYAWRGYQLTDGFAIQPSVTLGLGETGIALNIWGSAAIADRDLNKGADELDFTLTYDVPVSSSVGVSLGYIQYTFPNGAEGAGHTEETFASFSVDHSLAPSLTLAYDFGLVDAFYASAGVAPEFEVGDLGVLSLGASVAMSDYADGFGFNDAQGSAALGLSLGSLAVTPFVGLSYSPEEINPDNTVFWGGVSIGLSF